MIELPDSAGTFASGEGSSIGAGPVDAGEGQAIPPSPAYVPVRAAEDMMAKRAEQIFRFGHTPEADQAKPLLGFALDIESLAKAILEDVQFNKSHDRIRTRLVKLGALAMATVDRIDNEGDDDD